MVLSPSTKRLGFVNQSRGGFEDLFGLRHTLGDISFLRKGRKMRLDGGDSQPISGDRI